MIEQQARVISIQGDQLMLQTATQTACGGCEAKAGCGTSVLSKVVGRKFTQFNAANTVNAKVGDEVVVALSESALLTGSMVIYLWPLLGMMVAGMAADWLLPETQVGRDLLLALLALCGFGAVFGFCKHYLSTAASQQKLRPVVLRKVMNSRIEY